MRFCKHLAVASALSVILSATVCLAQENDPIRSLPYKILRQFLPGNSIEQIVARVLQPVRKYDFKGDGLDATDIETAEIFGKAAQRAQFVNDSLRFDLDGDFKVTEVEAQAAAERQFGVGNVGVAGRFADIMSPDKNKDGTVTIEEMANQEPPASQRRNDEGLRELLRLDPDDDGQLQPAELETLVRAAFAKLDLDSNGILDRKELPVPLAQ